MKTGHLEITTVDGSVVSIPMSDWISMNVDTSVLKYVDTCQFAFNNNNYGLFNKFENSSEVRIVVSPNRQTSEKEIFSGLPDEIHLDFEKTKNMSVIRFKARSYTKLLVEARLTRFEMKFEHGFGEVVKKFIAPIRSLTRHRC